LESGYELIELFSIELEKGRERAAAPLQEREGGNSSWFVEGSEGVHGGPFRSEDHSVALLEFEFGRNRVAQSGGFEIWWNDDADSHSWKGIGFQSFETGT